MIDPTDLKARINHYFEQSKGEPALDEKGERVMQKGFASQTAGIRSPWRDLPRPWV
jgi:hypothetical protein